MTDRALRFIRLMLPRAETRECAAAVAANVAAHAR